MATLPAPQDVVQELKQYFSSYLTDASATVSAIKTLVYQLIAIELPPAKAAPVMPDMVSIVVACKKSYDDLRRIQSLLKGHVRAKKSSKSMSARNSRLSLGNYQQIQKYTDSSVTPSINEKEEDLSTNWNPLKCNKMQSRITMMTQLTESERKSHKKLKTEGQSRIIQAIDMKKKQSVPKASESEPKLGQSRIRSVQLLKKIENLRESRAFQLQTFQQSNQECVGIIATLKEQLRKKKAKNSRQLKKK